MWIDISYLVIHRQEMKPHIQKKRLSFYLHSDNSSVAWVQSENGDQFEVLLLLVTFSLSWSIKLDQFLHSRSILKSILTNFPWRKLFWQMVLWFLSREKSSIKQKEVNTCEISATSNFWQKVSILILDVLNSEAPWTLSWCEGKIKAASSHSLL